MQPSIAFESTVDQQKGPRSPRDISIENFPTMESIQVDHLGSHYVFKLASVISLGSFILGLTIANLNTCISHIAREFQWCSPEHYGCGRETIYRALATSAIYLGCLIGSLCAGNLLKGSRRFCLSLFAFCSVLACVNEAMSSSIASILWGRLLNGICSGGLACTASIILGEISPKISRGFYGSMHQIALTSGVFLSVFAGIYLHNVSSDQVTFFDQIWWRCMVSFPCLPGLLLLILINTSFKFETPQDLLRSGHKNEAYAVLYCCYDGNEYATNEAYFTLIEAAQRQPLLTSSSVSWMDILCTPSYRLALLTGCAVAFFHQFTGINVFNAASNRLFEEARMSHTQATLSSTLLMASHAVFALPSLYLTDHYGRRKMLLYGLAAMTGCVIVATIGSILNSMYDTAWVILIGTLLFIITYSGTYGAVAWIYLSEIYPYEIKPKCAGLTMGLHWFFALIIVFLSQVLQETTVFCIFSVSGCIGLAVLYRIAKETKGCDVNLTPYSRKRG